MKSNKSKKHIFKNNLVVFAFSMAVAVMFNGCASTSSSTASPIPQGKYMSVGGYSLYIVDERTPAGWVPQPQFLDSTLKGWGYNDLDGQGVGTVTVARYSEIITKVPHVDRTAPVFILKALKPSSEREEDETLAVPVLGPNNEAWTQLVRVTGEKKGLIGTPYPSRQFMTVAEGEHRPDYGRTIRNNLILVLPVAGTPDLVIPIGLDGLPVPLPAGVKGVRPVLLGQKRDMRSSITHANGWAVQYPDGWGISFERNLKPYSAVRYSQFASEKQPIGQYDHLNILVAQRVDGGCEGIDLQSKNKVSQASCQNIATAARDDVDAKKKMMSQIALEQHEKFLAEKAKEDENKRKERAAHAEWLAKQPYTQPVNNSTSSNSSYSYTAPAGLPTKSHSQIMSEYNDYYKGRGNSCPFSDRSLCK